MTKRQGRKQMALQARQQQGVRMMRPRPLRPTAEAALTRPISAVKHNKRKQKETLTCKGGDGASIHPSMQEVHQHLRVVNDSSGEGNPPVLPAVPQPSHSRDLLRRVGRARCAQHCGRRGRQRSWRRRSILRHRHSRRRTARRVAAKATASAGGLRGTRRRPPPLSSSPFARHLR